MTAEFTDTTTSTNDCCDNGSVYCSGLDVHCDL